ncbi:MAG TPA: YceI family protein [Anaeromyxobacteraceae bacterium]|nr:YceI family protein [Anaeromyxobacteraceae bacterium]
MRKLAASLLALAPVLALAADWNIDPAHTQTSFAVRHLVISTVRGEFGKTSGTIHLDDSDLTRSSVEATIDAATVSTRNPDRDAHLRSPDFFDVARYPTVTFRSTKVEKAAAGALEVTGDLTLRGVTRPVTLHVALSPEVKGMGGETRRGFSATTRINRQDYGLRWSKMVEAGPVAGDEVTISLDVEAVREQPKAASN